MAAVRLLRPPISLFFFFFFFFLLISTRSLSLSDTDALLQLKKSFTNAESLDSWTPDSVPCTGKNSWVGVVCFNGIVTGLRLGQMGLSGTIDVSALTELKGLRSISFHNNAFSGPVPEFNRLGALKGIYLSGNKFNGSLTDSSLGNVASLKKLWLADNQIAGKIPESLLKLPHLIELHLENNQFSGPIPAFKQSGLKSFNVSNNKLTGQIPPGLSKFDPSSFSGNSELCGEQTGRDCKADENDSSDESAAGAVPAPNPDPRANGSNSNNASAAMVVLSLVIIGLLLATIVVIKRRGEDFDVLGKEIYDEPVEVYVSSDSIQKGGSEASWRGNDSSRKGSQHGKNNSNLQTGGNKGDGAADLTVVNDEKGVFGLTDLMKAAAEVLGNGGLGSAYKAVMANGVAVVVKRMREMNRIGKDGFKGEMRRLGSLRHRNILTPLAYHYRKEEKLIVSEYIPKGSLLYLLHGDRGPYHADLNWPARLKIVKGIAHGLKFLYNELASYELPHGNLKTSNIFLGSDYEPLLSDYGFCAFVSPTQAAQTLFAFKAPEFLQYHQISPKSDVYCLGIVILEILTGKFPSQYLNNGKGGTDVVQWVLSAISEKREAELFDPEIVESANSVVEMERLLHIGAACVERNPDQRLDMKEAIRRIEQIQIGSRTVIQASPTLRDGYADLSQSHAVNVRDGQGELSSRRSGRHSNEDNFAFAIS